MVFKCCVINCRTNYDTQPKKYPVFAFPSHPELRQQWIDRIETKSSKITHSSRVCVRHFNPDDVKMTNKLRTILKPNAVPVGSEHVIESESESEDEEEEMYDTGGEPEELIKEDFIEHVEEEILFTFEDFNAKVDENQQAIAEHWNIYIHPTAICFYRLTTIDDVFNDVNISYKIIVSNEMQIKLFKGETEASSKEINWAIHNSRVQSWEHFDEILDYYRQEPEIVRKRQPVKDLLRAFEVLNQVVIDELKDELDNIKLKFGSIIEKALQISLPEDYEEEEEEAVDTKEGILEPKQEVTYVEALDEALVTLDETSHFDDPMDGLEEIVVDVAQTKEEEELKVRNKCPNCFITCVSEHGLISHMKSCNAPIFNNNSSLYKTFAKKASKKHFKSKENYEDNKPVRKFGVKKKTPKSHPCSFCSKDFFTPHSKKEHEKTHQSNPDLEIYLDTIDGRPRYCCPKCSQHFEFSFILKKHIDGNCQAYEKKRKYRYPCNVCGRQFITKIIAAKHMKETHDLKIDSIEKWCFECNAEFEDYVNHIRIHSCNFACRYCGAKFLTEEKAMNHQIDKHSNETENDRRFKCVEEFCGLSFKSLNHLRSHQQSIHGPVKKEYQCDSCTKQFSHKSLLNAHARSHINLAVFPCNVEGCDRRFKKLNNLKEHSLREHGIGEIYLCGIDDCDMRFKMLQELKQHRLELHGSVFHVQKYFEKY